MHLRKRTLLSDLRASTGTKREELHDQMARLGHLATENM
jgi:hypothetical protein